MATKQQEDHWTSEAYQNAASFVPKLATRVVEWLDVQADDKILDLGCGDGILTNEISASLTTGSIHGTDSSPSMIQTAQSTIPKNAPVTYSVLDTTQLEQETSLQTGKFSKVFSNAALHWILRKPETRKSVFVGAFNALQSSGSLVFEMGGMGNVAEMRTALLSAVGRRIGLEKARQVDPWFFPDEAWMRALLEEVGFAVEKSELQFRPTRAEEGGEGGGIEGWVRLMGKQFFDAVPEGSEREASILEVVENLRTVCESPSGGSWIGYVRLRVKARKP